MLTQDYIKSTHWAFIAAHILHTMMYLMMQLFRFICLYRSSLSKLQVVGNRPFANDEDSWPPDKVIVDAVSGRGSLYHHGKILKCTYEECKDLEVCAVWELSHLVDMLMGDTKIDRSIRRPKDV